MMPFFSGTGETEVVSIIGFIRKGKQQEAEG